MVFLHSLHYVLSISGGSLFLMTMMMMNLVFAGPTGFTLKLIHRDSPKSPHYRGNLTKLERLERDFQQSKHRERKLLSTWQMKAQAVTSMNNSTTNNSKSDTDMVLPDVKDYDGYTYMVELGIGTFSSTGGKPSYYDFYFDTGSDLLWLQCDATRTGTTETKYFKQNEKKFNEGEYSLTYNPLPYDSPNRICKKYVRLDVPPEGSGKNLCGYRMGYADGAGTEGVLATEKISVRSDNGHDEIEEINDFVFGCGYRQNEPEFGRNVDGENPIAGILGLGGGQESFVTQLGARVDHKFEYCLKPWYSDHESSTLLRFGYNTKIVADGDDVQTTRTFHARGETLYYVTMTGISIGNDPVVYPDGSNVFVAKRDGTGGCVFDSGSELTTLSAEVYVPFKKQLIDSMFKINITRRAPSGEMKNYDLCFKNRAKTLPTITFHFDGGADFVMAQPQDVFASDEEKFCLIIRKSEETKPLSVVLGARQLANHRILHDNNARTISWVHDVCDLE